METKFHENSDLYNASKPRVLNCTLSSQGVKNLLSITLNKYILQLLPAVEAFALKVSGLQDDF